MRNLVLRSSQLQVCCLYVRTRTVFVVFGELLLKEREREMRDRELAK